MSQKAKQENRMIQMNNYNYLIIGAGPAGVQMGFELQERGLKYAILEQSNTAGAFFKKFPRHRKLISINKVYTGHPKYSEINERWDWNSLLGNKHSPLFGDLTDEYFPDADLMVDYINQFASMHKLNIMFNTLVTRISQTNESYFLVETNDQLIMADKVIVATGRFLPNTPSFEGVEYCEEYPSFDCDKEKFKGKDVIIVGKGNSAFETADSLIDRASTIHIVSPKTVKLAWRTHYVGHLRAVNNNFLDTFQLKSQNGLLDADILSIDKVENKLSVHMRHTHAENQHRTLAVDYVILATGFKIDTSIFSENCRPELTSCHRLPVLNTDWSSVNIKNLYFIGNLMHQLDYQKSFSGFIHGFRYNIRTLANILNEQYHHQQWQINKIELDEDILAQEILARLQVTGALFQQPGFICDLYEINRAEDCVKLKPHTQIKYEVGISQEEREYFTVTLEFGSEPYLDPFDENNVTRFPFSKGGEFSTLIHPVIRAFVGKKQLMVHHIHQTLDNNWQSARFSEPLKKFLLSILNHCRVTEKSY